MKLGMGIKLGKLKPNNSKLNKSGPFKQNNKSKLQRSPKVQRANRNLEQQKLDNIKPNIKQDDKIGTPTLQRLPNVQKAERKLKHQVSQDLHKRETKHVNAHNQFVDALHDRNDVRGALVEEVLSQGSKSSVQRVVLDLPETSKAISNGCQKVGIDNEVGKGLLDGFAAKRGLQRGSSPSQNKTPGIFDYFKTAGAGFSATPQTAKLTIEQAKVVQKGEQYKHQVGKLTDVRLANLALKKGQIKEYSNGQIKSGSLQADSPEALAAMLNGTTPASLITPTAVKLDPVKAVLAPTPLPAKLKPITGKEAPLVTPLSPKAKAEQQLKERDAHIHQLEAELLKQDPKKLDQAIRERDYYQTRTVKDVLFGANNKRKEVVTVGLHNANKIIPKAPETLYSKETLEKAEHALSPSGRSNPGNGTVKNIGTAVVGAVRHPKATAIKGSETLYQCIPRRPQALYSEDVVKKAEYDLTNSIGAELGNGNAEKMLQAQAKVVNLHNKGRNTAKELHSLQEQKIYEKNRNMLIDADGDVFYDAFKSPSNMYLEERKYSFQAKDLLPRQEDKLYLDDDIVPLRPPNFSEWVSRPLGAWLRPPTQP